MEDKIDLNRLCVHTQTTKPWDLHTCIKEYHKAGIPHLSIWRHLLENQDLKLVKKALEDHQLKVTSLVRGGFSLLCLNQHEKRLSKKIKKP